MATENKFRNDFFMVSSWCICHDELSWCVFHGELMMCVALQSMTGFAFYKPFVKVYWKSRKCWHWTFLSSNRRLALGFYFLTSVFASYITFVWKPSAVLPFIGVARGGQRDHAPPQIWSFCALRGVFSKQNRVIRVKSNSFPPIRPQKFWAGYATASFAVFKFTHQQFAAEYKKCRTCDGVRLKKFFHSIHSAFYLQPNEAFDTIELSPHKLTAKEMLPDNRAKMTREIVIGRDYIPCLPLDNFIKCNFTAIRAMHRKKLRTERSFERYFKSAACIVSSVPKSIRGLMWYWFVNTRNSTRFDEVYPRQYEV